jgi:hypothetical protein
MCTLSIIPTRGGYRVVVNRDEQRSRAAGQGPAWRTLQEGDGKGVRVLWPTDPVGGGTWVAASERGLTIALLNFNLEPAPELPADLISRGSVIPALITARDGDSALDRLAAMDLHRLAPFRLVAMGPTASGILAQEARWDRRELVLLDPVRVPACFASSGLGDSLVRPRLELFHEMGHVAGLTPAMQDAFHRHSWPGRRHISVLMFREAARTVSITTMEVRLGGPAGRATVHAEYESVGDEAARQGLPVQMPAPAARSRLG